MLRSSQRAFGARDHGQEPRLWWKDMLASPGIAEPHCGTAGICSFLSGASLHFSLFSEPVACNMESASFALCTSCIFKQVSQNRCSLPSFPVAFLHKQQIACFCHFNHGKERNMLITLFFPSFCCNELWEPRALSSPQPCLMLGPTTGDFPGHFSSTLLASMGQVPFKQTPWFCLLACLF